LIAFGPRLLIGVVAYFVYRGLRRINEPFALLAAGVLGTATNTVLVLGMAVLLTGPNGAPYLPADVAWTVAGIAFIGLVLKLLPSIYQVNGEIIAVTLPSHLGVALSLRRQTLFPIGTRRRRAPQP